MTEERTDADARAEAYLDGELSRMEAATYEEELAVRPEAAEALGKAILLRDLLQRMPPLQPPSGLEERIVEALRLEGRGGWPVERGAGRDERASALPVFGAALNGASWLFRPTAAVMHGSAGGAGPVATGLSQMRWVLGPLAMSRQEPEPASRRPAWRRFAGALGRLGGLG